MSNTSKYFASHCEASMAIASMRVITNETPHADPWAILTLDTQLNYSCAVTFITPKFAFRGSATASDISGSQPAIKSSTTPISSWPQMSPPLGTQPSAPFSCRTRKVGTPQIPKAFASAVSSRSLVLVAGALAFAMRSGPLKPPRDSTSERTVSSLTFSFCSQQAASCDVSLIHNLTRQTYKAKMQS